MRYGKGYEGILNPSFLFFKIEMTNLQRMLYYLGFGLFITSSWLAFIGFLLRSVK
jgi:hypothetical protein